MAGPVFRPVDEVAKKETLFFYGGGRRMRLSFSPVKIQHEKKNFLYLRITSFFQKLTTPNANTLKIQEEYMA